MKANPRSRAGAALHVAKEKPACDRCSKRKFQLLACDSAPPHQHSSAHRRKCVSASTHTLSEPPANMASASKKTASTTECEASQEDVSKPFCRKLSKDSKAIRSIAARKQENVPHSSSSASAVIALKEDLRTNTDLRKRLQAEINAEKQAAGSAASEAMAMIARLREEKAAVLVESQEFKRMAEERELHDRESIARLKEMLFNKDEVTIALEKELQTYREMFFTFKSGMAANLDSADLDACVSRSDDDSSHLHSMYVRRCYQTNFPSLIFDDASNNLIKCFNQAGEVQARGLGEQPISDKKTNHEIRAALGNILAINSRLEECETESVEVWRKVSPLRSFGKTLFIADELQERGQKEQKNMSPRARSRKLEKVINDNSLGPKRRYMTEYPFPGRADTERPLKFHCKDATSEFKVRLHGGRIETPVEMLSEKSEEDSIRVSDSKAHDNEEKRDSCRTDSIDPHNSNQSCVPIVIDNCSARHSSSFKDPELADPELAERHSNFPQPSLDTYGASTAFSRAEIERVHALETERSHTNDVRLTLQRENEDLKVFPAVAQALYKLRDEATPHSGETVKLDQPFSLFRGFSTLLHCRTNSHERGPSLFLQSTGSNPIPKRHSGPGLSYLLEKSPDIKARRMMTKGTKVRFPIYCVKLTSGLYSMPITIDDSSIYHKIL